MICILGATGRIGHMLYETWPANRTQPVIRQGRGAAPVGGLCWDMLVEPVPPEMPRGSVILNLAGVTRGDETALTANVTLALAALDAAQETAARHVFLCSSAAVYGAGHGQDLGEEDPTDPVNPYGRAKLAMEVAAERWAAEHPAIGVTVLRIGNVAGADALLGGAVAGRPVTLDPVPGHDRGPERSYIGPWALGQVLAGLADLACTGQPLPFRLNIAAPGVVGMADLLRTADLPWGWGPPNPSAVARVGLNTARLEALLPAAAGAGNAEALIADWRRWKEATA